MKLSRRKWGNEDREITNGTSNGKRKQKKMKRLRLKKIEQWKQENEKKEDGGKIKIEYHEDKGRNRFHIKDFIHHYFQFSLFLHSSYHLFVYKW